MIPTLLVPPATAADPDAVPLLQLINTAAGSWCVVIDLRSDLFSRGLFVCTSLFGISKDNQEKFVFI